MTLPFVPIKCWVADPAWEYNQRREFRKDNPLKKAKAGVGAGGKYRLSPKEELIAMGRQIQMCSAADCLLNIWVTCPILMNSLTSGDNLVGDVIRAWGFEAKFIDTVWVKTQLDQKTQNNLRKVTDNIGETRQLLHLRQMLSGDLNSTLFEKNMGFYVPGNVEIRIGCVRGRPIHENTGFKKPPQILEAPEGSTGLFDDGHDVWATFSGDTLYHKNSDHSEKPQASLDRLTNWLGPFLKPGEFCEIFARRQSTGWHCYGNELTGNLLDVDLMNHARKIYGFPSITEFKNDHYL